MPTEIIVPVENKPGTLARVAEVLGAAGVNLHGISYAMGARGAVRVITDNTEEALAALKRAKLKVKAVKEVLELSLPDRPGTLGEAARKLAKGRVNIEAFYVIGANSDGFRCVFAVDKLDKARAILGG
ncbi:MAG: hypothetical protein ACT4OG_06350 [Alphaproteobacteria bacterium]